MPEAWKEPFGAMIMSAQLEKEMMPHLICAAVTQRTLSQKAIVAVLDIAESEEDEFFQQDVPINKSDGPRTEPLLPLCFRLMEQSYELACSTFDEPQLAILVVNALCLLCKRFPMGMQLLVRLARLNELAAARVVAYSISNNLPLDISFDGGEFVTLFLQDFRTLIKRRHTGMAGLLIIALPSLAPLLDNVETIEQSFELMHLWAEFVLQEEHDYWKVISIPQVFANQWKLQAEDPRTHRKHARPIKLCIARALEATGDLAKALEIYKECEVPELEKVEACVEGSQLYASIKRVIPLAGVKDLTSRDIGNGKVALVFRKKEGERHNVKLSFLEPETASLVDVELPSEVTSWKNAKIIPDRPSKPLRILVAPRSENEDESIVAEIMQGMFTRRTDPLEPVELWQHNLANNRWKRIRTRGCIPDKLVISRDGNACTTIDDKVIVFGGSEIGQLGRASTSTESSAGAYLLDLVSREWLRIPHPYAWNLFTGPCTREQMNISTPPFNAVWNVEVGGSEMVAMLRSGEAETNKKKDNELVPKYALDLIEIKSSETASGRPEPGWILAAPTSDQCGYVATMDTCCIQVGSLSLVLGMETSGMVQKLQPDGKINVDFPDLSGSFFLVNGFDFSEMEWRGLDVYNLELLQDDDRHRKFDVFTCDADPSKCHILFVSEKAITLARISNLNSTKQCLTKRLSDRKRLSKKTTLSYQLEKADKNRVRPLRECASCKAFESPHLSFNCCSRCRIPFYCSKQCQRRHWKYGHSKECKPEAKEEADDDDK